MIEICQLPSKLQSYPSQRFSSLFEGNLPLQEGSELELFWESTYAIVVALMTHFPDHDPTQVGLNELAKMIESLPGFADDSAMGNERILMDIQIVWYEEASNL